MSPAKPKNTPVCEECKAWLESLEPRGYSAIIPEIADYEVRRELLRAGMANSIRRLDQLSTKVAASILAHHNVGDAESG